MTPRALRLGSSCLLATAIMLSTAAISSADSPYQPPLTALADTVSGTTAGSSLPSVITFSLSEASSDVIIQENFLDGLLLDTGTAITLSGPSVATSVVSPSLRDRFPSRESWDLMLGNLPAGNYAVTFRALTPNSPDTTVRNSGNFTTDGGWNWRGNFEVAVQLT